MGDAKIVRWRDGWTRGEFVAAVVKAGGFAPGAVMDVQYRHDPGCPKLVGGPCRCDPEVTATITSPAVA